MSVATMFATLSRYRVFAPWAVLAIGTTLLLLALRLPPGRIDVPYQFEGDALDKLAQIKNVAETGWLFHNDRLGFPFGYDRLDFPRFDSLNYALMAPLAWLLGPEITINVYFAGGFYLIAFAAFWCLRRLRIDVAPSVISALAYAFLPYHVLRGVAHLTNGAYFLIPFAMLVAIWLALDELGTERPDARKRWILALVVAVLVPLQTPYNGVFFAYIIGVACIVALARNARARPVFVALSLLAAIAGAFLIEQTPVVLRSLEAGKPELVAERMPVEAEL
jgi:phosphoglycerol transferase